MAKILLVDDDQHVLESTRKILEFDGHHVECASDGAQALERMRKWESQPVDVILSDIRMPKLTGEELFSAIQMMRIPVSVILMTAFGSVDQAVQAMKKGAVDFLSKPFNRKSLLDAIGQCIRFKTDSEVKTGWIGVSTQALDLQEKIAKIAQVSSTVLILGESGTGKELVAKAIHEKSSRSNGPFVALNCAALPENLIESELFGYERGAFSGAMQSKRGLFEAAESGTLFLDEIGDMPVSLQSKLLRVLEQSTIRRIGATQEIPVNVRILSATHQALDQSVHTGRFRQDLFYRLDVVNIKVPALRERLGDVDFLADYFLNEFSKKHQKKIQGIKPEARMVLNEHVWPGNVRELKNLIERVVLFAQSDWVGVQDLPEHLVKLSPVLKQHTELKIPIGTSLEQVQDLMIKKTLEATDGNKEMTAKLLGINTRTIYRRLEKGQPDGTT